MAKICPECNSTRLVKNGSAIKARQKVQRYRCLKCYWQGYKVKWSGSRGKDASKQPVEGSTVVLDNDGEV
jgi:transposase-like protein